MNKHNKNTMKTIKNLLFTFLFCSILVIILGCPYQSEVPVSEPYLPVDESLFGIWVNDSSYAPVDSISAYSEITKFSTYEFKLTKFTNSEKAEYYICHFSEVDNDMFINASDPETMKYYIYKLNFSNDKKFITLLPVTDYIKDSFNDSQSFKTYVSKYKSLSFFFSAPEYYVKADKPIIKKPEIYED